MGLRTKRKFFSKTSKSLILTVCLCMALLMTAMSSEVYADNDQRSTGTHANLVLFAYFADESEPDWFNQQSSGAYTDSVTQKMTNAERYIHYYSGSQNRSFSSYMSKISDGSYQVENVFPQYDSNTKKVQAIKLSMTKKEAETANCDAQIVKDLSKEIDLSAWSDQLDSDGDGVIDNVSVVLQGPNATSTNVQTPSLRSHKFTNIGSNWGKSGLQSYTFNMLNTTSLDYKRAGLIAHEYLHSLLYPDLYRQDGSSDEPVGNWDIMSEDGRYMNYPLAYLRMAVSNWVQVPEIDEAAFNTTPGQDSTVYDVELETISDTNLCNAVMITSPLNPYEKFVIEVREKPSNPLNGDDFDGGIPKSGVIVYRVDTTVEGYSNFYGKTGVYVFGTGSSSTREDAALDSSKPSYGNSDMTVTTNAITFSNGTNTGIVVSDVTDINSGKVTLKVTVPKWSALDPWDSSAGSPSAAFVSLVNLKVGQSDRQVAVAKDSLWATDVKFYEYGNNGWSGASDLSNLTDVNGIGDIKVVSSNDTIFAAYVDGDRSGSKIHVMAYDSGGWKEIFDENTQGIGAVGSTNFDIGTVGGKVYISYMTGSGANLTLNVREITGSGASAQLGTAMSAVSGDISDPRVLEQQGSLVISYRENNASTSTQEVKITGYNGNDFTPMTGPGQANSYDILTYNQELYFVSASSSELKVKKYDTNGWQNYATGSIDSTSPKLAVAQGNLYVIIRPATQDKGVYAYEVTDSGFVEEGMAVDLLAIGTGTSMIASGDRLFIGYTDRDNSIAYIKEKVISNSLLSLTITPPDKEFYIVGDIMDLSELKVVANFQKNTRELAAGEYDVTVPGFAIENGSYVAKDSGDHVATVTMVSDRSISNTFSYMISDVPVTASVASVRNGADESTQFTYGDVVDVTVETSGAAGKQIALYYRQADGTLSKLTEPIEVTEDKAYQLSYDTKGKLLPTGDALSLAVCFVDGDVITSVDSVDIALLKRTLTASIAGTLSKTYDGTANAPDAQIELSGVVGGEASAAGTVVYDSPTAGERTLSVEDFNVNFSSGAESYYAVPDAPTAAGSIAKADAPTSAGGQLKVTNNYA